MPVEGGGYRYSIPIVINDAEVGGFFTFGENACFGFIAGTCFAGCKVTTYTCEKMRWIDSEF
jgi:hypothetical protein